MTAPSSPILLFVPGLLILAVAVASWEYSVSKTQVIQTSSKLQTGKTAAVRLELKKSWPWSAADTVKAFSVRFDGAEAPIPPEAWKGLHPVDPARGAVIVERGGFPEVILFGKPHGELTDARYHFLNYSFSQRRILKKGRAETTYYAGPALASTAPIPSASAGTANGPGPLVPSVSLKAADVHPIPASEIKK